MVFRWVLLCPVFNNTISKMGGANCGVLGTGWWSGNACTGVANEVIDYGEIS